MTAQARNMAEDAVRVAMLALLIGLMGILAPAHATQPDEMMADPAQEARARHIGESLRCLVCQNQSIDDSDADLARDLRLIVRQRIAAGDSDEQVKSYLVARYGDYILLRPPFKPVTYILWLGPPGIAAFAGFLAFACFRRRRTGSGAAPEDKARMHGSARGKDGRRHSAAGSRNKHP